MRNNEFELFTIGFTQKPASAFFETLRTAQVARVIDVRLNNVSQLAAFSKRDDLKYFLNEILGVDYVHETLLAPTQDMLDRYKKRFLDISSGSVAWDLEFACHEVKHGQQVLGSSVTTSLSLGGREETV
jgi:hypothetical protein